MTRVVVDTNVFVYRLDSATPEKRARAVATVDAVRGRLVVPVQVLAETSRVLLHRRRPPLPPDAVLAYIDGIRALAVELVPLTSDLVDEAVRAAGTHGFSYFDAQIWAAARAAGATVLLTEDFQDGHEVEGVRVVNPFAAAFDVAAL